MEISEAISELLARLPTASAAEGTRLNAIVAALGQLDKVGAPTAGTGVASNGELWGAFTYAWTQAGRVVHFSTESMAQAGQAEDEAGQAGHTERRALKSAKILRPRNVHEFYHMLSVWQMVCQAVALATWQTHWPQAPSWSKWSTIRLRRTVSRGSKRMSCFWCTWRQWRQHQQVLHSRLQTSMPLEGMTCTESVR